jgi:hypothetical protein
MRLINAKAMANGLYDAECALICLGPECKNQPQTMTCPDSNDYAPEGYVLLTHGHLYSNSSNKSFKLLVDTEGFDFQTCGPNGNICIQPKGGKIVSCCNYVGSNFPEDSDACMLHFALHYSQPKIQILENGC